MNPLYPTTFEYRQLTSDAHLNDLTIYEHPTPVRPCRTPWRLISRVQTWVQSSLRPNAESQSKAVKRAS
jgi:hypothetical protein